MSLEGGERGMTCGLVANFFFYLVYGCCDFSLTSLGLKIFLKEVNSPQHKDPSLVVIKPVDFYQW